MTYEQALFQFFDKPERFPALFSIHKKLDDKTFWSCFHAVWVNSESIFLNMDKIETMLTPNRFVSEYRISELDGEDRRWMIKHQDRKVRVYRGCGILGYDGMSWTTSRETAVWFAQRYGNNLPTILSGYVEPKDIIARHNNRDEKEVVVFARNVSGLKQQTLVPARKATGMDELAFMIQSRGSASLFGSGQQMLQDLLVAQNDKEGFVRYLKHAEEELTKLGFNEKADEFQTRYEYLESVEDISAEMQKFSRNVE